VAVAETIGSLVGVYHANGGLRGELAYALGKLRGTAHCGLCDISHGGLRRKPEWDVLPQRLGVPLRVVHLNERTEEVARASAGHTPCVLAGTPSGLVVLLGPDELDRLSGDVDAFADALVTAAASAGLAWPGDTPG
jgi:hypothetical protein